MATLSKSPTIRLRKAAGFVLFRDLIDVVRIIARRLNIRLDIEGMDFSEAEDGLDGVNDTVGEPGDYPFKLIATGGDEYNTTYTIRTGSIAGVVPKYSGNYLWEGVTITVPNSGTRYLYFEVNYDTELNTPGTIVVGGQVDTVNLVLATSPQTSSKSLKKDYWLQAVFVNGENTGENHRASLAVSICDDGTGNGYANLLYGQA